MQAQTVQACAEFSEKAGQIIAALIREQPGVISTITFTEFARIAQKFSEAIQNDPESTIKGSEIFEEFRTARAQMIECLQAEQQ